MKETVQEQDNLATPQIIELQELHGNMHSGETILGSNLDVVRHIKTNLTVVVGEATMSIGDLMSMKSGQLLQLTSPIDSPVDILLENCVVARGQLVAVGDNFGVRITEIPESKRK